jgi:phosphomannomutase
VLAPQIFKANDIRGIVDPAPNQPSEWDEQGALALGWAYGQLLGAEQMVVVSHDMRVSGPRLEAAFVDGVTAQGVHVVKAGLASTDQLWFASGYLDVPGVQFTASHNPSLYNGLKFCRRQAQPVSPEFLVELAALATAYDQGALPAPAAQHQPGRVTERDLLAEYAAYLHKLVNLDGIRRLKVVVDAGNGMAGHTAPAVLGPLNVDIIGLYLDLDGSFPNHQPNPLVPENLIDARQAVREHGADIALVFDGDADRCFVIDELGEVVPPSAITAMIAVAELEREPGATVVINTITSDAVRQIVAEHGGEVVESQVGHTYVKAKMADHQAIFGGEHSAHYYFREFWGADTGLLAGLHVLNQLGRTDQPLSELSAEYTRFYASGEINSTVRDADTVMARVADAFDGQGAALWGDGVKVVGDGWWFNLRPSNTEPLLRLNVEASSEERMRSLRDTVLSLIAEQEDAS